MVRIQIFSPKGRQADKMARKNSSSRKPADDAGIVADSVDSEGTGNSIETPETYAAVAPTDETPAAKPSKTKVAEEPATGSVGLGDIRKAVAFANSVGGLDKAMALLQIVKVAKEVQ
jgi:hypothetical protein